MPALRASATEDAQRSWHPKVCMHVVWSTSQEACHPNLLAFNQTQYITLNAGRISRGAGPSQWIPAACHRPRLPK